MSRRAARVSVGHRRPRGAGPRPETAGARRFGIGTILVAGLILAAVAGVVAVVWIFAEDSPASLRPRAVAAGKRGHWEEALRDWRTVNRIGGDVHSRLGEARAALALGRAAQAESALIEASRMDPTEPEPWLIRLEILRIEDRRFEAQRVGWTALESVRAEGHREVLRALTLALLAEPPDDLARRTLRRWIDADADDQEARVALFRRMTEQPRADDPTAIERVGVLEKLLRDNPEHVGTREVLLLTLAESGQPDRGREWLDDWPTSQRDARFERLRGLWALEYDGRPDQAVDALRRSLAVLPQDWKTRYRLARALQRLGRIDEARRAAEDLARLREVLDPARLGPRFDADLEQFDEPAARRDLAELCESTGLKRLAAAWREDVDRPAIEPRPLIAPGPRFP